MFYNTFFEKKLHHTYNVDPHFIKKILDNNLINFSLSVVDSNKNTLLHLIIMNNDMGTFLSFFNHLKTANYSDDEIKKIINICNSNKDTPLHLAVINNNQVMAEKLYLNGAKTNIANNNNFAVKFSETDSELNPNKKNSEKYSDKHTDSETVFSKIINKVTNAFKQNNDDTVFLQPNNRYIGDFTTDNITTLTNTIDINSFNNYVNDLIKDKKYTYINVKLAGGEQNNVEQNGGTHNSTSSNKNSTSSNNSDDSDKYSDDSSKISDDSSDKIDDSSEKLTGGSNQVSEDTDVESLNIFNKINKIRDMNLNSDNTENLSSLNLYKHTEYDGGSKKMKRAAMKREKENFHEQVLEIIKKINDKDAPFIKAALWNYIKDKYPNDNNFDKSSKMLELAKSSDFTKFISTLKIDAIKSIIESKNKDRETDENKVKKVKKVKEPKEPKEKKSKTSKTSKEPKEKKVKKEKK